MSLRKFFKDDGSLDCAVQNLELGLWDATNCGRKKHYVCELHDQVYCVLFSI